MHSYRLTKFDPRLRLPNGRFDGEDWASINDIGTTFNGVVLTHERYAEVENAHITAVEAFARESGVSRLALREPNHLSPEPPFHPGADDAFWAEVDRLAEQAGEPIPVLETWVEHQDRRHLVGPGARPVFAPRAILAVCADPPREVDDAIGEEAFRRVERKSLRALIEADELRYDLLSNSGTVTEWLSRLPEARRCGLYSCEPALEAVLPDPDGVVRARWTSR